MAQLDQPEAWRVEMESQLCPCGSPLHYYFRETYEAARVIVEKFGPSQPVTVGARTFLVPRHFTALHGLRGADLVEVAARYGFEEVGP